MRSEYVKKRYTKQTENKKKCIFDGREMKDLIYFDKLYKN